MIILEEDVEVAVDFFELFAALAPMLDNDDTLLGNLTQLASSLKTGNESFCRPLQYIKFHFMISCFVVAGPFCLHLSLILRKHARTAVLLTIAPSQHLS